MSRRRLSLKWLLLPPAVALLWFGGIGVWLLWVGVLVVPLVWKGRWRWRPAALLLTPFAVALGGFAHGVVGYATGTARLEFMGLPDSEFDSLDPQSRAEPSTGGCVVWGPEVLTQVPNNAAVETLARLFGPMPFSYRGPYPTREEAASLLCEKGEDVTADEEGAGVYWIGDVQVQLRAELRSALNLPIPSSRDDSDESKAASSARDEAESPEDEASETEPASPAQDEADGPAPKQMKGVVLDGRLLVLEVLDAQHPVVRLVDLAGQRLVATYVQEVPLSCPYAGPYPTKEEAAALICERGQVLKPDENEWGAYRLGDVPVRLGVKLSISLELPPPSVVDATREAEREDTGWSVRDTMDVSEPEDAKGVVLDGRTLVLAVGGGTHPLLHLVDLERQRLVMTYADDVELPCDLPAGSASHESNPFPEPGPMTAPALIWAPPMVYPKEALAAGVEGAVLLRCEIRADGTVHGCKALKSIPLLDQAAIRAVEPRRYQPVTYQGKPISVQYVFRLVFRLPGKK